MDRENHIVLENQKNGSGDWLLTRPATNREIEGYASKTSVNVGEEIHLFVSTKADFFYLTIYRMGWYQGLGAREISSETQLKGTFQTNVRKDPESGLIECDWINPDRLVIPAEWTSGVYLVKLKENQTDTESYIIFVVRNDSAHADILFQLPVTTYQAYNYWGGKSLYEEGSGSETEWGFVRGQRAHKVSFNRPYAKSNNPEASYGMGAGEFLTNVQPNTTQGYPISSAAWDYNMLRWLEKNGYHVSYITNLDTHLRPEILARTKIFMSHGHDEYWSAEMRLNVENIRDQGIHLAFFSSNTMFWQARFEEGLSKGEEPRTLVCYKDNDLDPVKGKRSTINFRDLNEVKGEAEIIGVEYVADPVHGDFVVHSPSHWVFDRTGLKKGDKIRGLLGYEVDSLSMDSPKNLTVLGKSKVYIKDKGNSMQIDSQRRLRNILRILKYITFRLFNLPLVFFERFKLTKSMQFLVILILFFAGIYLMFTSIETFGYLGLFVPLLMFLFLISIWFLRILFSNKFYTHMTIYQAQSGASVFASGTMQWSWGLDDFNVPALRRSYHSKQAKIITTNVLSQFGALPATQEI